MFCRYLYCHVVVVVWFVLQGRCYSLLKQLQKCTKGGISPNTKHFSLEDLLYIALLQNVFEYVRVYVRVLCSTSAGTCTCVVLLLFNYIL